MMENNLPFEYGFLYKPVEGLVIERLSNSFYDYTQQISLSRSGGYDYNVSVPFSNHESIDWRHGFKPVGFIESTQRVIGDVYVIECTNREVLSPSMNNWNMSFNKETHTTRVKKPIRVEIDVNDFIKNFEKIL